MWKSCTMEQTNVTPHRLPYAGVPKAALTKTLLAPSRSLRKRGNDDGEILSSSGLITIKNAPRDTCVTYAELCYSSSTFLAFIE